MSVFAKESPQRVGAYNTGAIARLNGQPFHSNPYVFADELHDAWRDGWRDENSNFCGRQNDAVAGEET